MSLRGAQSAPKQSPVFLRKRLFGDCLGPAPMVQDRDLAPSLGRRTGGLPETGLVAKKSSFAMTGYVNNSSNKSFHLGFMLLIMSNFLWREPALICFSQAIAALISLVISKYTRFLMRTGLTKLGVFNWFKILRR